MVVPTAVVTSYVKANCNYVSLIRTVCYCFTVTAQEGPGIVIVHPAGQDVELLCTVMKHYGVVWLINHLGPYGVSALHNGIQKGYSANITTNNLIIEDIMMNDVRNNTEYRCGLRTQNIPTILQSVPTILYIAGEYQYTVHVCSYSAKQKQPRGC